MNAEQYYGAVGMLRRLGYGYAMAEAEARRIAVTDASDEEYARARTAVGAEVSRASAILTEIARECGNSDSMSHALLVYTEAISANLKR